MPKPPHPTFSSLALNVGSKVQLVLDGAAGRSLLSSTLIGYLENQFLLIKLPSTDGGAPVSFLEGEVLTVRVFTGTSVCMFDATVLRRELHPFYCLHLTYPQTVQSVQLRSSIRIQTDFACTINDDAGSHTATIINLSTSGALIRSAHAAIVTEAPVTIAFTLSSQFDAGPNAMQLKAIVRSLRSTASEAAGSDSGVEAATVTHYGVQFMEIDPADQLTLQNYAYEILLSDRRRIL